MAKLASDSFAIPAPTTGDYGLSDQDRINGLHQLCEGCLGERDYQSLAEIAGLAHRYNQLAHIIYRVDDIIMHGPRRRRR